MAFTVSACVSGWQAEQRPLERLAASAALAAVYDKGRLQDTANAVEAAKLQASADGYSPDAGDITIINNPPTAGPYAGSPDVIEVILERPASSGPRKYLAARAVATFDSQGNPCLLTIGQENERLTDVGRELLNIKSCRSP